MQNSKTGFDADVVKVLFVATTPATVVCLGAVVAVNAAHELVAAYELVTTPRELVDKLMRFLVIWPLIPGLLLSVAAFALIKPVRSKRARSIAERAYAVGLFVSLVAYTFYGPYFALFKDFWKQLTECTYFMSILVTYLTAYRRLYS